MPRPDVTRSATFSCCRTYRWSLSRIWGPSPALVIAGLNPSTADELQDDPTIRRGTGFARAWGHGGLVMVNLFAFRSTDPRRLREAADPIGPENDATLRIMTEGRRVLLAWGVHGTLMGRDRAVIELLRDRELVTLGLTKDGHPRHPLYVPGATLPIPFVPKAPVGPVARSSPPGRGNTPGNRRIEAQSPGGPSV